MNCVPVPDASSTLNFFTSILLRIYIDDEFIGVVKAVSVTDSQLAAPANVSS